MVSNIRKETSMKNDTQNCRMWRARGVLLAVALGGATLIASTTAWSASPTAVTAQGEVIGITQGTTNAFLGVPYAAPPVGALRLVAPQPHASWSTPLQTTQFAAPCPQVLPPSTDIGSEDCLYLNVYTPSQGTSNLPVMVFFPGGDFIAGTASEPYYNGQYISQQSNVVVVTVSYRLGALGFLAAPSLDQESPHHVSGNYGLQDEQAALNWVRSNIAAFKGNANNVTIFGQSAGANSVEFQLASPLAAGLFRQAIIESAAGFAAIPDLPLAVSEAGGSATVIAQLGCAGASNIPACLRALPAYAFLNTSSSNPNQPATEPVVDGYVLLTTPLQAFASGQFNRVPTIIGSTHDEMTAIFWTIEAQGGPLSVAGYTALVEEMYQSNAAAVLVEYPASAYPSPIQALATLGTDANFACPSDQKRAALALYVPTYGYEFHEPNPAVGPLLGPPEPGLTYGDYHTSDLPYVFGVTAPDGVRVTGKDLALSQKMIGYWTSFAADSYPFVVGQPTWIDYLAGSLLSFQDTISEYSVTSFVADHKCNFWNGLPPET
jgi:para-nitrobenzyl esterase